MSVVDDQFLILGIETSCDETAAAVVSNGTTVVSSVVYLVVEVPVRDWLVGLGRPRAGKNEPAPAVRGGWFRLRRRARV